MWEVGRTYFFRLKGGGKYTGRVVAREEKVLKIIDKFGAERTLNTDEIAETEAKT